MNRPRWLPVFVCALSLAPSLASADEPSPVPWAQHRVEDGLVKPLSEVDSPRFSRVRLPPRERKVRILEPAAIVDKAGHAFLPFAIDVRYGADWRENDVVGCVYLGGGDLFVKRGDDYRPAAFLLGKNEDPVPGVCRRG